MHLPRKVVKLKRGVYLQPYTGIAFEGLAFSIDSQNRRLLEVPFVTDAEYASVMATLREHLDRVDPKRHERGLRIVAGCLASLFSVFFHFLNQCGI